MLKLFDMTVATTGLNEKTAAAAGVDYDKTYLYLGTHAGYYPGGANMSIKALWDKKSLRLLGAQIVMGIYYFLSYRLFSSFEFHAQSVKLPLVLPLIAMIFTYLAVRAIFRDELMIRSMDRIR